MTIWLRYDMHSVTSVRCWYLHKLLSSFVFIRRLCIFKYTCHGRRKRVVCRGSDTQLYMWRGYWYVYVIPSHANCMQHVLRWWERQSDGSEYKKTLRWLGLCPGPHWGSLQRSCKPPSWWGGAGYPLPKNLSLALGPSGLASSTPHSKISSDAVDSCHVVYMQRVPWSRIALK